MCLPPPPPPNFNVVDRLQAPSARRNVYLLRCLHSTPATNNIEIGGRGDHSNEPLCRGTFFSPTPVYQQPPVQFPQRLMTTTGATTTRAKWRRTTTTPPGHIAKNGHMWTYLICPYGHIPFRTVGAPTTNTHRGEVLYVESHFLIPSRAVDSV